MVLPQDPSTDPNCALLDGAASAAGSPKGQEAGARSAKPMGAGQAKGYVVAEKKCGA